MSVLLFLTAIALADSPLTVPRLYVASSDDPLVERALETSELDDEMMRRLSGRFTPTHERVALANALGWDVNGQSNAVRYLRWLDDHNRRVNARDIAQGIGIRDEEAFVLGYLMAMDDYLHPERALPLLDKAREEMPKSRSVAWVHTLVRAQRQMPSDWCAVWRLAEEVRDDETLNNDLPDTVEAEIMSYLSLYAEYCPPELDEETEAGEAEAGTEADSTTPTEGADSPASPRPPDR